MTLVGLSNSLSVGVSPSHAKTIILFPYNCSHGFTMMNNCKLFLRVRHLKALSLY